MDLQLTPGWTAELDRGPEWLFVKLQWEPVAEEQFPKLAEPLWRLLQQHLLNRLILELDHIPQLDSHLIGEFVRLRQQITSQGGMLRLAGMSDLNQETLIVSQLADRFPQYRNRDEALMGYRPKKPR